MNSSSASHWPSTSDPKPANGTSSEYCQSPSQNHDSSRFTMSTSLSASPTISWASGRSGSSSSGRRSGSPAHSGGPSTGALITPPPSRRIHESPEKLMPASAVPPQRSSGSSCCRPSAITTLSLTGSNPSTRPGSISTRSTCCGTGSDGAENPMLSTVNAISAPHGVSTSRMLVTGSSGTLSSTATSVKPPWVVSPSVVSRSLRSIGACTRYRRMSTGSLRRRCEARSMLSDSAGTGGGNHAGPISRISAGIRDATARGSGRASGRATTSAVTAAITPSPAALRFARCLGFEQISSATRNSTATGTTTSGDVSMGSCSGSASGRNSHSSDSAGNRLTRITRSFSSTMSPAISTMTVSTESRCGYGTLSYQSVCHTPSASVTPNDRRRPHTAPPPSPASQPIAACRSSSTVTSVSSCSHQAVARDRSEPLPISLTAVPTTTMSVTTSPVSSSQWVPSTPTVTNRLANGSAISSGATRS